MIDKIKGFIEDNTDIDVTRNQVKMALFVLVSLLTLIVVILFQMGTGPKEDPKNFKPAATDFTSGDYRQN
jgi:uncharacterized protein YpmS